MKEKEQNNSKAVSSRLPKWDNLKGLLILCVVIGHFIQNGAEEPDLEIFRTLFLYIYSFHIPLFIFIMGLFYRRSSDGKLKTDRIWFYLILYVALKTVILLVNRMLTGEGSISLLTEDGTPWYMFATAVYMWLAYLVRHRKPCFVLFGAFLLGILAGYDNSIGDYLVLSRILVFAPFFFLGYYLEPKKLTEQMKPVSFQIAAGVVLLALAIYCSSHLEEVYWYRPLMTGRNAYKKCVDILNCGGWNRILIYGAALLAGGGIAVLMPNKRLPFLSVCGQRSLSIYFWHRPILYILDFYLVGDMFKGYGNLWYQIGWIAAAVLLTFLLSWHVFEFPLEWLSKMSQNRSIRETKVRKMEMQ